MVIHKAGYSLSYGNAMPVAYTGTQMLLSYLSKVGVNKEDDIIIACDGRGNWRKELEEEYKGTRSAQREKSNLDWDKIYNDFDWLLEQFKQSASWYIIGLDRIEADDIASVVVRENLDKEIVLISFDQDWQLLWNFDNVKIFSPLVTYKSKKGAYKVKPKDFNPYELLNKKIRKEVSDDLVNEVKSEEQYEIRKTIVNLLELPDYIEEPIKAELQTMKKGTDKVDKFPFENSLRKKFAKLYEDKSKVITYEDCVNYKLKKRR